MERTGDAGIAWRNFRGAGARTTQYRRPDRQVVPHTGRRSPTAWGHLQEKRRRYRARLDAAATTSHLFDELTKRSLLARIVKVYPELESMITGAQSEDQTAPLIASLSSLERRKTEYEELVKTKIPENTREIALARSYGDLSENFEFKAAKQMQSVLMRRKTELEQMLHNARGTSFENVDTSRVSIGTIVTLRNVETGQEETYTILGAWDGDPDHNIISYQTAIGQALLGHKAGETISLNTEHGSAQFAIVSIQPAPPDQTAPPPTLLTESAVETAMTE